jgi:hypothetical protein
VGTVLLGSAIITGNFVVGVDIRGTNVAADLRAAFREGERG